MARLLGFAIAMAFVGATATSAQRGVDNPVMMRGVAVAEQVLAAERAFDALAASDGQWTAFRATAADDAVLFVPQRVEAQTWLAGRADPPRSVRWQPHGVFVSCDGLTATTYGQALWPDGSFGRFRTIWQRQADGAWKWVLDAGWPVAEARPAPSEPDILIANCTRTPPALSPLAGSRWRVGSSADTSLRWYDDVDENGRGDLSIQGWNGRFFQQLSSDRMGPPLP